MQIYSIGLRRCISIFGGLLFPNRCALCGAELEEGCGACRACADSVEVIGPPTCARCGAPLEGGPGDEGVRRPADGEASCPQCSDLFFACRRNESLGVYQGTLKVLIHLYKFQRRRTISGLFIELLARHKKEYVLAHDVIVPVPLNGARYLERGYNQSFLIARGIARALSVEFHGELLRRRGSSPPQSGVQTRERRLENVTDRFYVKRKGVPLVDGKRVLLVDDVLTTGATASRCATALVGAGALSVDLLTLARAIAARPAPVHDFA